MEIGKRSDIQPGLQKNKTELLHPSVPHKTFVQVLEEFIALLVNVKRIFRDNGKIVY